MANNIFNLISVVAFFTAGYWLLRFINKFEPQWVSKDGQRFSAKIYFQDDSNQKMVEIKVLVDGKLLLVSGRTRKAKPFNGKWTIQGQVDSGDPKRQHYLIVNQQDLDQLAVLRVPSNSKCVVHLNALV